MHFGLVPSSGVILDHYSCLLPRQTLRHNQQSLLDYLNRIGQPKQKAQPAWQAPSGRDVNVVDIISMAVRENMAETSFFTFSLCSTTGMKAEAAGPLEAQPLILLRSTIETQKQFLVALYEE